MFYTGTVHRARISPVRPFSSAPPCRHPHSIFGGLGGWGGGGVVYVFGTPPRVERNCLTQSYITYYRIIIIIIIMIIIIIIIIL